MRPTLAKLLRDPSSGNPLNLVPLQVEGSGGDERIVEGLLYDRDTRRAYPIVEGVPVMLDHGFAPEFLEKHAAKIATINGSADIRVQQPKKKWSFSTQWGAQEDFERTWGYSVEERVEMFLMETNIERDWCEGKLILDAGCGNGTLTEGIAGLGANVVGLDFSSAVQHADSRHGSRGTHFVQGDLLAPPLPEESFDAVTSIGVLHHTVSTQRAFHQVSKLVKPGGHYYVWLYRRPESAVRRLIKTPAFETARTILSRMPHGPQALFVRAYAAMIHAAHRFKHKNANVPAEDYVLSAYDDLTPRWRHYHTAYEVAEWFYHCGFLAPTLSHWDNPYGFGMVAVKKPQQATPGIHYGNGVKLWDGRQTIIG